MVVDFLFDVLFPLLLRLPAIIFDILNYSLRDLIADFIGVSLPSWSWLNFSLLALMLGSGLSFFLIFTLIKWILDLIS